MDGSTTFVTDFLSESPSSTLAKVIMSSLATLPAITASYTNDEQVAIFTANGKSLLGLLVSFTWSSYAFNSMDVVVKLCIWGLSKCFCFQGMESLIKAECGVDVQELLLFQDMMYDMFYILTYHDISKDWLSSPTCTLSAYQHNQKSMARCRHWRRTNDTFSLVVKKFRASKPWLWEKKWMSLGIQIRRSPKRP